MTARGHRRGTAAAAIAGGTLAAGLHLALLWTLASSSSPPATARAAVSPAPPTQPGLGELAVDSSALGVVLLAPDALRAFEARTGLIDFDGTAAGAALPDGLGAGLTAAASGGGAGGPLTVTQRDDEALLRAGVLSDPQLYRKSSLDGAQRDRSPEALDRDRAPSIADRTSRRRRARAGEGAAQTGAVAAPRDTAPLGAAPSALLPTASTDARDDAASSAAAARERGAVSAPQILYADEGERAVDQPERGPAEGVVVASVASDAIAPMPFDLGRPSRGGVEVGLVGAPAGAGATTASARGVGDGAWAGERADGADPAVRAARSDPYFRALFRRLDEVIEFPRELALALEQGDVIVSFELAASGTVSEVTIVRKSRRPAFDQAVLAGIARAGSFGPVPARLLRGRRSLRVQAFYAFSNPLIR